MPDSLSDLPLWVKVVGSLASAMLVAWGALVAVVEPFADARFVRRFRRCGDTLERHMRDTMFAGDAVKAARRDEKLDAINDRLTKIDAVQLVMGDALRDLPSQIKVLERVALTIETVNTTMGGLQAEVKALANEHHEMRGMIEAWREPTPGNPLRPRKARRQA